MGPHLVKKKNSPHCMGPESLLWHLQEPANGQHPKPGESSLRLSSHILEPVLIISLH
jgi:hypothetical protein